MTSQNTSLLVSCATKPAYHGQPIKPLPSSSVERLFRAPRWYSQEGQGQRGFRQPALVPVSALPGPWHNTSENAPLGTVRWSQGETEFPLNVSVRGPFRPTGRAVLFLCAAVLRLTNTQRTDSRATGSEKRKQKMKAYMVDRTDVVKGVSVRAKSEADAKRKAVKWIGNGPSKARLIWGGK